MSNTYIGKVQIGSQFASVGSTLYGVCATAANEATKTVTLNDFDKDIHGVTVFVKFNNGNTVSSNATLTVGGTSSHGIIGNCTCNSNEILAFTLDMTNSSGVISETIGDWHWIVVGHVAGAIEIATATPSAVGPIANIGSSIKYAKEDHVHNIVVSAGSNTGDISIAGQTVTVPGLDTFAPLASPTFTGTVTIPALTVNGSEENNVAANKKYVDDKVAGILAGADAMTFRGTLGTGGTITALPDGSLGHTYLSGDTYKIITAGTYAGQECEIGDLIIAIASSGENQSEADSAHWTVVQTNIDGAVTGPVESTNNHIPLWDGTNGNVLKNSNYTIETSVPSGAVFRDTTYTLNEGTAYTGHTLTDDSGASILASVSQGVLTLAAGIKFTTGTVGTGLTSHVEGYNPT